MAPLNDGLESIRQDIRDIVNKIDRGARVTADDFDAWRAVVVDDVRIVDGEGARQLREITVGPDGVRAAFQGALRVLVRPDPRTPAMEKRFSAIVSGNVGSVYVEDGEPAQFVSPRLRMDEDALRTVEVELPRDPASSPETDARREAVHAALEARGIRVVSATTRFRNG